MDKFDGVLVSASAEQIELYKTMKEYHNVILSESGQMWNWPITATLTAPTIGRIIQMSNLYQKIIQVPGNVLEFGVHFGASSNILMNLRRVFEPNNSNRQFHMFDTFEGFQGTSEEDGKLVEEKDFRIPKNYAEFLNEILEIQKKISNCRESAHKVWTGDATVTVETYLNSYPHHTVALVFFDMDIFTPTKNVLEKILPRLTKGSVIVFDQFNCDVYPGETLAVMEVFDLRNIRLKRDIFSPHTVWMEVE